ncbi:hypothetical protein LAV79_18640 [Peribacillus butanolivorans]|uniref:group II intron maturase-specific domain-containing protein n=1 Tax=Peribacillus butanolivorans TaxID=421767 RepID=UPI0030C9C37A
MGKPDTRIFLGVSFYWRNQRARVHVPKKTKQKFEEKLKKLNNRNWGIGLEYRIHKLNQIIQGWGNYFKIGDIKKYSQLIDAHIRRRLRGCRWKERKKSRTKYRNLKKQGISSNEAWRCANSRKGYRRNSNNPVLNTALSNQYGKNKE